jgi:hypothetical protein
MSTASQRAVAGFGATLQAGMLSRGGGASVPAQATAGTAVELTREEQLSALESRIEASLDAYQEGVRRLQARHRVEVGQLLDEISETGLWELHGYTRFGDYVKGRWGWDRSYGYRLMDLAVVQRALAPLGPAVTATVVEAHSRELAPVVRHNGDEEARNLLEVLRLEAGEKKVTAAAIRKRRDQEGLGVRPSAVSPIGDTGQDEDEVVDAELVEDEAEKVGVAIRTAADTAEKALRQLEDALATGREPFHQTDAARDLSRIRSAAVRMQRRADTVPGADN